MTNTPNTTIREEVEIDFEKEAMNLWHRLPGLSGRKDIENFLRSFASSLLASERERVIDEAEKLLMDGCLKTGSILMIDIATIINNIKTSSIFPNKSVREQTILECYDILSHSKDLETARFEMQELIKNIKP